MIVNFFKFNAAEINRERDCLEILDSEKRLIVDQTHLVLVGGSLVLQKDYIQLKRLNSSIAKDSIRKLEPALDEPKIGNKVA